MADLLKFFGSDTQAEREGVWHTLAPGFRVKIARWNNPDMQRELERCMEPFRDVLDREGQLSEEDDRAIMAEVMAKSIVRDWSGAEIDGDDVPFTEENVQRVLSDPRFRDLRLDIQQRAQRANAYRIKAAEDDAKNSKRRSAGS